MYVVGIYEVKVTRLCLTLCDPRPHFHVLCPWNSPGKNTGVGFHFLFHDISPTQGLNLGLPHCRRILYHFLPATREALWVHTFLYKNMIDSCTIQIWTAQIHLYFFFPLINTIVPHDPRLTESMDMEGRLLIICGVSTEQRVGAPNTCAKFKDRVCVCVYNYTLYIHYIFYKDLIIIWTMEGFQ